MADSEGLKTELGSLMANGEELRLETRHLQLAFRHFLSAVTHLLSAIT